MRTNTDLTPRLAAVLLAAPILLLSGCAKETTPPPASAGQTYSVRGEIARLPQAGEAHAELWIRHEPIPEFTTEDGRKAGMESMTMPFALAPGLSLEGFAAGEKVRFTLEIRWSDPSAPARITRLERLPADTELAFGPPPK